MNPADHTILIVDDEDGLRESIAFDFRRKKFNVATAACGKDAVSSASAAWGAILSSATARTAARRSWLSSGVEAVVVAINNDARSLALQVALLVPSSPS